jgi:hypothetical protein
MYKLEQTRYPELFRLEVADQVYLISKEGISILSETICHEEFTRKKMADGVAIHLNHQSSYVVENKFLDVEAVCKTSFGPLGDRLLLNVDFDGTRIGNISAMKSYMGGGISGTWPLIHNEERTVLFTFSTKGMFGSDNKLLIEYYQTMIPHKSVFSDKREHRSIKGSEFSGVLVEDITDIVQLEVIKQTEWEIPVKEKSNQSIGSISCISFPGYEKYRKVYYGKWNSRQYPETTFFDRTIAGESLYGIEIKLAEERELLLPWGEIQVVHHLE